MRNTKSQQGFTLIEMLVVIAIVGVLAGVVMTMVSQARVKARDAKRRNDLVQIQKGLELYYTTNNNGFPNTNDTWYAATGSCGGSFGYSGPTGYVPDLAPNYISFLPADPKPSVAACSGFNYRSDGVNYKVISNSVSGAGGPETFPSSGEAFYDPARPTTGIMVTNNPSATATW